MNNLYTNYKNTDDNLDVVINEMSSNMSGFDSITLKPSIEAFKVIADRTVTQAQPKFINGIVPKPSINMPIGELQRNVTVGTKLISKTPKIGLKIPSGFIPISTNEVIKPSRNKCPANSSYIAAEDVCKCNSGYQPNASLTGCEKIVNNGCPENSEYNATTNMCDCKEGYVADATGKYCIADPNNGGGGGNGSGNGNGSGGGGGGNGSGNGNGSGGGSGSSGSCPENSTYNASDGACHCNEGFTPNEDGSKCVKYSGEYTDEKEVVDDKKETPETVKTDNKYYYMAGVILAAAVVLYILTKKKK